MHGNHLGALPLVTLRWQGIKELGWKETFSTKIQYNSHRIKKKRAGSNINPESTLIKYQCSVIWENRSNSAGSQNYNAVVATEESLKSWPWDVWRMSSERCSHVVVVFSVAAVSHWTMMNVITACTLLNEPRVKQELNKVKWMLEVVTHWCSYTKCVLQTTYFHCCYTNEYTTVMNIKQKALWGLDVENRCITLCMQDKYLKSCIPLLSPHRLHDCIFPVHSSVRFRTLGIKVDFSTLHIGLPFQFIL